jgi:serine/threonine protein kinase
MLSIEFSCTDTSDSGFCILLSLASDFCFLRFLSKFNHPNIVRFLGISTDDHDNSMYLLLELMEGGELRAFVRESRPKQVSLSLSLSLSLNILP